MKEEWETYWNNIAANMEEAASRHEYRTLYKEVKW